MGCKASRDKTNQMPLKWFPTKNSDITQIASFGSSPSQQRFHIKAIYESPGVRPHAAAGKSTLWKMHRWAANSIMSPLWGINQARVSSPVGQ